MYIVSVFQLIVSVFQLLGKETGPEVELEFECELLKGRASCWRTQFANNAQ